MAFSHDRFFKFVFGAPDRALELLRLAPPARSGEDPPFADSGTLRLVPAGFVSGKLRATFSDLLFETDRGRMLVYILFEHKSQPAASTVLQLLGYLTDIWRSFAKPTTTRLPHIIPIIVYHGKRKWNAPRSLSDYFSETSSYGPLDPRFSPSFLNLAALSLEVLDRLSIVSRSAISALRWFSLRSDRELRAALSPEILASAAGAHATYFEALATYLSDTSTAEEEDVILEIVGNSPAREVFMTIADKWRLEGRTEGRTEGTLSDRREVLVRLASKKFGLTDEERRLIEDCDDLDRLASALEEILFAEMKEQVLAKLR